MEFFLFYLIFWVICAFPDPDPLTPLNPGSSGSETLVAVVLFTELLYIVVCNCNRVQGTSTGEETSVHIVGTFYATQVLVFYATTEIYFYISMNLFPQF
jgi:hypothetical protein